ncbi:unnamed protein product, partial [Thlaspi arvense]
MADRRNRCNQVLLLAYQSFGLVFGDLSISPLYVYKCTFYGGLKHHQTEDAIFGAFSLIFWTITLLSLIKYMMTMVKEGSSLCMLCSVDTRDFLCFQISKRLMRKSLHTMALEMQLGICIALLSKAL